MQNRLREINTFDLNFRAYDSSESWAAISIAREIKDQYYVPNLNINKNDVIIDIGAHVGIFSIYYALKYPDALIYSYEPTRRNYANLVKSLEYNKINNVFPNNLAVTSDGRDVEMYQPSDNTGGSSMFYNTKLPFEEKSLAKSIRLKDIIENINGKIRILKIDCEGGEYEILNGNIELLNNAEIIMGELHHVPNTDFNAYKLYDEITKVVGKERNKLTIIQTNTII